MGLSSVPAFPHRCVLAATTSNLLVITSKEHATDHSLPLESFPFFGVWASLSHNHLQCRRHRRLGFNPWVGKIPWKRKMATHSSILTWKIPWTEETVRVQSKGSQWVRHELSTTHACTSPNSLLCTAAFSQGSAGSLSHCLTHCLEAAPQDTTSSPKLPTPSLSHQQLQIYIYIYIYICNLICCTRS